MVSSNQLRVERRIVVAGVERRASSRADQEAYVTLSVITTSSPEHDLMLKGAGHVGDGGVPRDPLRRGAAGDVGVHVHAGDRVAVVGHVADR